MLNVRYVGSSTQNIGVWPAVVRLAHHVIGFRWVYAEDVVGNDYLRLCVNIKIMGG